MTTQMPILCNREQNRAKNKKASDKAIPFVYETVIAGGSKKRDDETFLEFYKRRPEQLCDDNKGEWEKEVQKKLIKRNMSSRSKVNRIKEKERITNELKEEKLKKLLINENWTAEEELHLDQKDCNGLDATLFHKLVPTICDEIGRYNPNALSSTEIEKYLMEVKNTRNNICHDPKGASVSGTILDSLETSAINVMKAAGDLYASNLDTQTVMDKIEEFKKLLQKIKNEVMTGDHQRVLQTAKKLSEDGMAAMEKIVRQQATDYLPFCTNKVDRTDVFHTVTASTIQGEHNKNAKSTKGRTIVEFPITELLQHHDDDIIFCEGVPGSGKTTLLRRLRDDLLTEGEKMFLGSNMFDLLLYTDCRDNTLETILQLLKRCFPKTRNQLNDQETLQALFELKLLICVDGLDELNQHSRKLLDELIRTFQMHGNVRFVCTSRPGQSDYLRSVRYKTVTLQPITNEMDQIVFLERYQENIAGIEAPELIGSFRALDQTCKDCLGQPIYLALFCFLFRKFGQIVCTWKNEVQIMEHIFRLSKQTMIDRMKDMGVENFEGYAADVANAITHLSVQIICKEQLVIDEETYTTVCRQIFGKANVRYYAIMSSFFSKHSDGQSFEMFHKSYLEYLAAKRLYSCIVSNSTASVVSIILSQKQNLQTIQRGDMSYKHYKTRNISLKKSMLYSYDRLYEW